MRLREVKKYFVDKVCEIYAHQECLSMFYLWTENTLKLKRIDVSLYPDIQIDENAFLDLQRVISCLIEQKPIQYVLGKTEFFGFPFFVDEFTLIPRPETEELVKWIIDDLESDSPEILDIGTGSGCIAISLKKNISNSNVEAIDICQNTLNTASKNADLNGEKIYFIKEDILLIDSLDKKYDIIVSNPPYVRDSEREYMRDNVLKYEPHKALFVSDSSPLLFYDKISDLATEGLKRNGTLYFEINENFGREIMHMLKSKGFVDIVLKRDFRGKDRMIKAKK
ncbi:peptide chain release factor N(5)-glutamine methyltransferase [Ichthyobacterium seriolicida]|uniref:peptide chain release factor N(5)-glutamine methyltransferase n=1 Tax=Ichthyobacterium seriolicida TaxID=242600 RepID=A0A1J1EC60_9FLAO|nr:peptide chain release factor N(5)-glutamine methyltransferase [Ichthyobacterium seriolicida]BAV95096.1 methylates polypeptide chain release factors [Ichthyobacterium seriolicida]